MLNRILSKKIKFPPSLRGAGRRSNLSGFSLIELMVAIAILAMAIFGIFQAYSAGFRVMADARDRTVATNYAREAMEDIKNMDFETIVSTTKSLTTSNIKYRVDVNVSSESNNLKKVYTIVNWKGRNGITKTVEITMLVNQIEVYASEATKIVLFADSYTILNTGTTELTAIIKDIKGNTIIDWDEGDITFSIFSGGELGDISPITVTPDNGIAKTTFSSGGYLSEGEIGYTVIEASVNLPVIGNVSDQVTIKVTDGPVKIILSADPDIIKASTENSSTITVSLCNAANQILNKSDLVTDVEITFSVFGEGNLSTSTITITAIGAEPASAEISLNSTGTPGLASVVATATDLESATIDIRFLGPPVSILITASPNPIYVDDVEGSTITVSLLDVKGFPTNPTEGNTIVTLTLSPDSNGSLSDDFLTFPVSEYEGILLTTLFSGQTSTDSVSITASAEGLTGDSVTINILSELVPDHIELTANPHNLAVGGTSTITATVYDASGKIVTNYAGTITFSTDLEIITGNNPSTTTNGVATIELSSDSAGTAVITVSSSDGLGYLPSGGVEVGFYGGAHHITLTADPEYVKADGVSTSTITATVYDYENIIVTNYNIYEDKTIDFFINDTFFSTNNFTNGIASITLTSDSVATIVVTAFSSDGLDCFPSDGVEVIFYVETSLTLVEDSAEYYPADLVVALNIMIMGEDILVDQMRVSWTGSSSSQRYNKIVINSEEVYTLGNDKSGETVEIIDKTLIAGEEYTVELTFAQDMAGRTITVIFYPYVGSYTIEFIPTTQ